MSRNIFTVLFVSTFAVVFIVVLVFTVMSYIVMSFWNQILYDLFGLPEVDLLKSLYLILFYVFIHGVIKDAFNKILTSLKKRK